jgi:hypothetical protein
MRLGLGIAFIVGAVVLVALWLVFQHRPGWYRPEVVTETMLQQARTTSAAAADRVSKQVVEAETFDVRLTADTVNQWLAALPHLWPDARRSIPPEISDLAVHFEDNRVRVGALYAKDGWQAIVSVGLILAVSGDGEAVTVTLSDARGGSLPVPRMILEEILQRVRRGAGRVVANPDPDAEALESVLVGLRSVDDLFDGVRLRNRFVWPNGRRPIRIAAIAADNGALHLQIEPL